MNEHRRQILEMLSEKKITPDEAERVISAAEDSRPTSPAEPAVASAGKIRAKYLRVMVASEENNSHDGPTKVNVRVPCNCFARE